MGLAERTANTAMEPAPAVEPAPAGSELAACRGARRTATPTRRRVLAGLAGLAGGLVWLGPATALAAPRRRPVPDLRPDPRDDGPGSAPLRPLELTAHVATDRWGVPIVSRERLAQWVARSNQALEPHGLRVHLHRVFHIREAPTHVARWRERRALADLARADGRVHVFVVGGLHIGRRRRPEEPKVRGLHWRYVERGAQRSLITVTADAPATTLVHEIGHLLGLPHDRSHRNLMCSCRRGAVQVFTPSQGAVLREGYRRWSARGRR